MASDSLDLAFVLVREARYPAADAVVASGRRLGLAMTATSSPDVEPMAFDVRGVGQLLVMLVNAPDPDATEMGYGPLAAERDAVAGSPAHFIVTALGLQGTPRERDTTMALLATTLIENTSAVAVTLQHGAVFKDAAMYAEMAALAREQGTLPAEIAVDFTVAPESDTRMSFLTHGMERYGREELYVTCPIRGKGAFDFVMQLVRFMLEDTSTQFKTGETIGRSADEKIRIQRVPHPAGGEQDVMRLDLPD